jgi:hypothetical protein
MNTKHLACVLLFAVVLGLFQGTMLLNKRMLAAMSSLEDAAAKHSTASLERTIAQGSLEKARKDTAAHRKYLEMWKPKFEQAGSESSAKTEFNRLLKRFPYLTTFLNSTSAPTENKEMSFVNRRIASNVKLEGDAERAFQFVAAIERDMPTSRIQNMELRKGQRGNDVELNLSVETPLLPAAPTEK